MEASSITNTSGEAGGELKLRASATEELAPVESVSHGDLLKLANVDHALAAKMHMVNDTLDEIGFTPYHVKLFFLNGFGYAVDSLTVFIAFVTAGQAVAEFDPRYTRAGQLSLYIGTLIGALFWGITADIIGRKWAFNISLFMCAVCTIIAGAAPNYAFWCAFNCLLAIGSGGNLILDTTSFLEYLPSSKQWVITLMAAWWGVGQMIAGFLAWGFLPNFSCPSDGSTPCTKSNNMGWRYVYITGGSLVLVMSILRVTVIRFHETPKYSVCQNDDKHVVDVLQMLAKKYNRPCHLTIEGLASCGQIQTAHSETWSLSELAIHYRGLFATKLLGWTTLLLCLSWALIGLAYPLFFVFLPEYLASRGAEFGEASPYITWRNYAITNFCAVPGPVLAAYLCRIRVLGHRYTMVIGAVSSMVFLFAYTVVRNDVQNLAFSCMTSFTINIYYAVLYAYTPTCLPSAHRGTGNGTAVACNRIMGITSVIIASFTSTSTSVPIYVCAAIFGMIAIVSASFRLEPSKSRAV